MQRMKGATAYVSNMPIDTKVKYVANFATGSAVTLAGVHYNNKLNQQALHPEIMAMKKELVYKNMEEQAWRKSMEIQMDSRLEVSTAKIDALKEKVEHLETNTKKFSTPGQVVDSKDVCDYKLEIPIVRDKDQIRA
jgi:hypothetical protein